MEKPCLTYKKRVYGETLLSSLQLGVAFLYLLKKSEKLKVF